MVGEFQGYGQSCDGGMQGTGGTGREVFPGKPDLQVRT